VGEDRDVRTQRFTTTAQATARGILIPVPFDPDEVWSVKPRHHVNGTVNGNRFRAVIETRDGVRGFTIGGLWESDCVSAGQTVEVVMDPEGPQRADLADDIAGALAASPAAAAFFDGLAQFYRKGYLRWIDGTKRRPDLRAERIARMVELLEAGVKDYRDAP
jgi:Bacteriocin-protection, YdeI or OmpD-Associated